MEESQNALDKEFDKEPILKRIAELKEEKKELLKACNFEKACDCRDEEKRLLKLLETDKVQKLPEEILYTQSIDPYYKFGDFVPIVSVYKKYERDEDEHKGRDR